MSIENEKDLAALRRIGRIVRLTLEAMRKQVRPGITTHDLDEIGGRVLAEHGARSAPKMVYGFPRDVLISLNDEAVHGIPGDRAVQAGDLVKLDVTAEKDGYMADAAVTVPVPPASDEALRIAEAARAAFAKGVGAAKAGVRIAEIGRAVENEVKRRGFTVVRDLAGHGIGRTIHEPPQVPNHYEWSNPRRLTDGLVITIEPIVAQRSGRVREDRDGWTIRTVDGGLTAHHEHTLVVTRGKPILLTAA